MRAARTLLVALATLGLAVGCGMRATNGHAGPPAAGWRAYSAPGVSMNVPDGWTVRQDRHTGRLRIEGPHGEQAFVWAVFLPHATSLQDPESLARSLTGRAWRDVTWGNLETVQHPHSLLMRGDDEPDGITTTALVGWTPTPKGTAVLVYAVRAETTAYRAFAATAEKAFATFRLHGTGGAPAQAQDQTAPPAQPALQWRRFVDPREQAFTAQVPQGWTTGGGMFRYGAVDVRFGLETRSPDGGIIVRFGDPNIGTFVTGAIGYSEGQTFSPGYGQMVTVRQYEPPAQFAAQYASEQPQCRGFQPVSAEPRPDLTRAMNAIYGRFGLAARLDAGDVSFTCGNGWRGYWLAVLQIIQMGGPAMWKPEYLLGYLARPSQQAEAHAVLAHLVSSIRVDPQWYERQTGQAASTSQVVSQTSTTISRMVDQGYWERHKNDRAMSIKESNAMLGIEQVEDPVTGDRYDVELGSKYHWINARGTIVGTQTDALPDMQMRLMTRVTPGQ